MFGLYTDTLKLNENMLMFYPLVYRLQVHWHAMALQRQGKHRSTHHPFAKEIRVFFLVQFI